MHRSLNFIKIFIASWIFIGMTPTNAQRLIPIDRAYVNELFTTKIEPKMFNWTLDLADQFEYGLSLKGYPDLPSWMRYMYSTEYHAGYLYGTPPERLSGHEVMESSKNLSFSLSIQYEEQNNAFHDSFCFNRSG